MRAAAKATCPEGNDVGTTSASESSGLIRATILASGAAIAMHTIRVAATVMAAHHHRRIRSVPTTTIPVTMASTGPPRWPGIHASTSPTSVRLDSISSCHHTSTGNGWSRRTEVTTHRMMIATMVAVAPTIRGTSRERSGRSWGGCTPSSSQASRSARVETH